MSTAPTRVIEIDNKKIYIFDDIADKDQIRRFSHSLEIANYSCIQANDISTKEHKEWVAGFDISDMEDHWLFRFCSKVTSDLRGSDYYCGTAFANAFSYGSIAFPHTDSGQSDDAEGDLTFLYFGNHEWDTKWGGELMLYDDQLEPLSCVGVKPGRLVCFAGDVIHKAGIPSRQCYSTRYTFSLRFYPSLT
ncbi:2OG-Fe(II) oxygenase [Neptuniibacter caesariensis]|uniref:Prolyl 4-hydroxylase alpha subunit Fe(2+) 2OG dioxygenase domain-containing protein n=1 Tax=Neptuniibacter caesariensis TaxID=207954 RepID=A0A7U8C754_NEPCE|nr:2OG-Fe(II) oxygenase [Neptuniibacter caesariensis]EAR62798.1 hypothetical protein MED92_06761 [Oceanospirillum sp. MED92] [Neptuniibacter caesariensis]